MEEDEFDVLKVYLDLLGTLVEHQEAGVQSRLTIHTPAGQFVEEYDQIEHLGLFRGSDNVLIIDNGYGVYIEEILELHTYKLEVVGE